MKTVTKRKKVILSIIGIFIILNLIPFVIPIHFPYNSATGCSFVVKGWHVELEKCKKQKEIVTVPGYILGRPVTTVGELCYSDNDKLISISFPKQTKKIDNYAFNLCTNLETFEAKNVTGIGVQVFYMDSALKKISWGNKLRTMGEMAFSKCKNIQCHLVNQFQIKIQWFSFRESHCFFSSKT